MREQKFYTKTQERIELFDRVKEQRRREMRMLWLILGAVTVLGALSLATPFY